MIRDLDGDGQQDGNEVYSSRSGGGTQTSVKKLTPGTYFVKVYFGDSGVSTPYTLSITPGALVPLLSTDPGSSFATATSLGALTQTRTATDFLMASIDNVDMFSFTLGEAREVTFSLSGLETFTGYEVIRDLDGDGQRDGNEVYSSRGGGGTQTESKALLPGTYFIIISISDPGVSTPYQLSVILGTLLEVQSVDPGNTLSTAKNLGVLAAPSVYSDILMSRVDQTDAYGFQIQSRRTVSVKVGGMSSSVSVQLINDANRNGVIDSGEIVHSVFGGIIDFVRELDEGLYYVFITLDGDGNSTKYRLTL